jgi:hypothetical protein
MTHRATLVSERIYDWTTVAHDTTGLPEGWAHWLLVRLQTEPGPGVGDHEIPQVGGVGDQVIPHPAIT